MTSLYEMSVPVYIRSLENLIVVLKAAETWADENKVPHSKLIEAKLADDMNGLTFQIQIASNTAKSVLFRIADMENVSLEDNEKSFEDCYNRIQKTIDALKTAKRQDFIGKEGKEVSMFGGKFKFTALQYMQFYGLPNFFFHVTTAYDILRKEGVNIGKFDFLGRSL